MSAIVAETLADEIAAFLEREGPSACDGIATGVHRLRMTVLYTLRADSRFVRSGRGRQTRWHLAAETDRNGNETGSLGLGGAGGTSLSDAGESLSGSRCSDPVGHASFGAHWFDDQGATWCVRCDVPDIRPLSFEDWLEGRGGEDARDLFESDHDALSAGTATPEQIGRMRVAFATEAD